MIDKFKFNPWLLVFAVIGLGIIGALHELIMATRESTFAYTIWHDFTANGAAGSPGSKAMEGEYYRVSDDTGKGIDIVNNEGETSSIVEPSSIVERGAGGRFQKKEK